MLLYVVVVLAVAILLNTAARKGMRPRDVETTLSPDALRRIFASTVTGWGWRIVDDGNPIVAQSHIAFGIRQRIALATETTLGRTFARIEVVKYDGQWIGMPREPWTLRMRINTFLMAVRTKDPTARVSG
jgi:hypothetical protein